MQSDPEQIETALANIANVLHLPHGQIKPCLCPIIKVRPNAN